MISNEPLVIPFDSPKNKIDSYHTFRIQKKIKLSSSTYVLLSECTEVLTEKS